MKYLFFIFILVNLTHSYGQNLPVRIYSPLYLSFESSYENIEKDDENKFPVHQYLTHDKKPYDGCLTHDIKGPEYIVYKVKNGKIYQSVFFFNSGIMSREFNFLNGQSHGLQLMYHENGHKYIEEYYTEGIAIDTHRRWHPNGNLAREAIFSMGLKLSEKLYDDNGKLIN